MLLRGLGPHSVTAIGATADAKAKGKRPPRMGDADLITEPDDVSRELRRLFG